MDCPPPPRQPPATRSCGCANLNPSHISPQFSKPNQTSILRTFLPSSPVRNVGTTQIKPLTRHSSQSRSDSWQDFLQRVNGIFNKSKVLELSSADDSISLASPLAPPTIPWSSQPSPPSSFACLSYKGSHLSQLWKKWQGSGFFHTLSFTSNALTSLSVPWRFFRMVEPNLQKAADCFQSKRMHLGEDDCFQSKRKKMHLVEDELSRRLAALWRQASDAERHERGF